MMQTRLLLSGDIGSGKTVLGEQLSVMRFLHVSASDLLVKEAQRLGLEPTREQLGEIADQRVAAEGPGVWSRLAIEAHTQVAEQYPGGVVLSGPRRPPEIHAAQEQYGFDTLYLQVSVAVRERRFLQRLVAGQPDMPKAERLARLDAFRTRSFQEAHGLTTGGESGINLRRVRKMANFIVHNNATIPLLERSGIVV